MNSFDTALEQAKRAGTAPAGNLPFLFKPQITNGKAVLLIHGFSASPYEMRAIGHRLCTAGYLALGVRLEGHGTNPEDLRKRCWQDWYASVHRGYGILAETGLPIDLVAQSTGALLALELSRNKEFNRGVLLSPFLKLRHPLARFAHLLKYLTAYHQRQLPNPQCLHYYERRPLAGIEQIVLLTKYIEPILATIQLPLLIMTAEDDQTVNNDSGRQLYDKLGSQEKKFHMFGPEAPHDLSSEENPYFEETCSRTIEFLAADNGL